MNFDAAFDRLVGNEGALSMDPQDRGNWTSGIVGVGALKGTKYGISAAQYPDEDIAALTIDRARFLYQRDFWTRVHADDLPSAVAFQAFDFAVNSGCETAVRYLQRALNVADDGVWGPITVAAAQAMPAAKIVMRFVAERIDYMRKLSGWAHNGNGWAGRAANDLRFGADDI